MAIFPVWSNAWQKNRTPDQKKQDRKDAVIGILIIVSLVTVSIIGLIIYFR